MAVEREIKLRFDSAEDARERILSIGATPLRGRRRQEDSLLDTADDQLYHRRCVLRVRCEGGKSILTFKGPVQPGAMKVREEHETLAADGDAMLAILHELGMRVWFRYEKFREEFSAEDVIIAVDETPVGVFVEIEGGEERIHETAAALGKAQDDYIIDSYRTLFVRYCRDHHLDASDMLFDALEASEAVGTPVAE